MRGIITIAHLTLHEIKGRKVALAALILGLAFLALYAVGFHFMVQDMRAGVSRGGIGIARMQQQVGLGFLAMAGLYAVNFLMVMMAVLMPVDTLSGDIRSGSIQTLVTKPLRRGEVVLGKWLAFLIVLAVYVALMAGGVIAIARLASGYVIPNAPLGVGLMLAEGALLMTLTILGGTRLSTLANGVMVFGLYGLAFIGGWLEQLGAMLGNATAQNVGVIASLFVPSEALWQMAAYAMQPPLVRDVGIMPFTVASVPSAAMAVWAAVYIAVALLAALRQFAGRDL